MESFNINKKRYELRKKIRRRKFIKLTIISSLFLVIIFSSIKSLTNTPVTTINTNVLNPPLNEAQKIVCIDPGHGDWDSGSIGVNNSYEKDIVLNIALSLGKLLEENNIKVIYTRTNDSLPHIETSNDSLKERLRISKVFKADLFISIHSNSNYDSLDSRGIETWYNPEIEESLNIANIIQSNLANLNYTEDRGVKTYIKKEDAFAVLEKNTAIPVLVELGFLSNVLDENFLNSERGQEKLSEALYNSILEYFNN